MTEVRRHQRTVDGKTVNVRHHTRSGTSTAAEKRQDAWEDRAAQRWTPPPRPEAGEVPAVDEGWWDDDVPRPEAWTDNNDSDEPEPERKPGRWELFKARAQASREMDEAQERFSYAKTVEERDAAERDFEAARDRLNSIPAPFGGR